MVAAATPSSGSRAGRGGTPSSANRAAAPQQQTPGTGSRSNNRSTPQATPSKVLLRSQPASRACVCVERQDARDGWNISEIKIQELFTEADKDNSGQLEQDEFRDLLREFNGGRPPTEQECRFMLQLSDFDRNGTIGLDELHFALRVWKGYHQIDDYVLNLYAEFDLDENGSVSSDALRNLMNAMNRGIPVPLHEVQYVMENAFVVEGGAVDRTELLCALAAWYVNVERLATTVPMLMKEAVTRTAQDIHSDNAATENEHSWRDFFSVCCSCGYLGGYSQVGDKNADGGAAHAAETGSAGGKDGDKKERPEPSMCAKLCASLCKAVCKLLYLASPFLLGLILIPAGWKLRENTCPRNLDGIMMWFGALIMFNGVLAYLAPSPGVYRAKVAVTLILIMLDLIGMAWARGPVVHEAQDECGTPLVYSSMVVWNGMAVVGIFFAAGFIFTHLHRLRIHEEELQKDYATE